MRRRGLSQGLGALRARGSGAEEHAEQSGEDRRRWHMLQHEVSSAKRLRSMFPPLTTATTLPVPHFPESAAATAQAPAPSAMT